MAAPLLSIDLKDALGELGTAMALYSAATGKSAASVLSQKGDFLSYALYNDFSKEKPSRDEILAKAKGIKWQFGRQDGVKGVSAAAWKKADALLGGNRSLLGRWDGNKLIPMWAGASGGFTKGQNRARSRTVTGQGAVDAYANTRVRFFDPTTGKWKYRKRAIRMYSSRYVAKAMGGAIYSRTFVARAMELGLRQRGQGVSAISWLHRIKKVSAKIGYVPEGTAGLKPGWGPSKQFGGVKVEYVRNGKGKEIIGRATLEAGAGAAAFRLESFASGMNKPRQQAIVARVLRREAAGTLDYLVAREAKRLSAQINSQLDQIKS